MRGVVNTSTADRYGPGRLPPERVRKLTAAAAIVNPVLVPPIPGNTNPVRKRTAVAAIVNGEIRELAGLERSDLNGRGPGYRRR